MVYDAMYSCPFSAYSIIVHCYCTACALSIPEEPEAVDCPASTRILAYYARKATASLILEVIKNEVSLVFTRLIDRG